ncbi:MAG: radical SAM protein, partial [Phycisphaerae bacterium]
MGECLVCRRQSREISRALSLCAACILADTRQARAQAAVAHAGARRQFRLPKHPPQTARGIACQRCVNACKINSGQIGYCGVRRNEEGRLSGGDAQAGAVQWYYDPLPTNCVADWVCPASGPAGYPDFTDTKNAEHGHSNLAVFYEACSFNCLFCQNWHFRAHSTVGPRKSATDL